MNPSALTCCWTMQNSWTAAWANAARCSSKHHSILRDQSGFSKFLAYTAVLFMICHSRSPDIDLSWQSACRWSSAQCTTLGGSVKPNATFSPRSINKCNHTTMRTRHCNTKITAMQQIDKLAPYLLSSLSQCLSFMTLCSMSATSNNFAGVSALLSSHMIIWSSTNPETSAAGAVGVTAVVLLLLVLLLLLLGLVGWWSCWAQLKLQPRACRWALSELILSIWWHVIPFVYRPVNHS